MSQISFGTFIFTSSFDVSCVSLGTASWRLRRSISHFLTCPNCTRKFGQMLWEAHSLIHQVASLVSGRARLFASGEPRKKMKKAGRRHTFKHLVFGFVCDVSISGCGTSDGSQHFGVDAFHLSATGNLELGFQPTKSSAALWLLITHAIPRASNLSLVVSCPIVPSSLTVILYCWLAPPLSPEFTIQNR